jgi:precorrin-6B methylase 2
MGTFPKVPPFSLRPGGKIGFLEEGWHLGERPQISGAFSSRATFSPSKSILEWKRLSTKLQYGIKTSRPGEIQMSKSLSAIALIFLIIAGYGLGQTKTVTVEPWELSINARQPVQKVIETIGLKPGMVIGEVGAGTGRVTVWLAVTVGPTGKVYANDIDARALDHLKKRCEKEGLANVTIILGTVDDPRFPRASLDIAFMTNTYHHLEKPVELVRNLLPALRENGILAIVERDKDRTMHKDEATSQKDFIAQMDRAGFEVINVDTSMQEDNIYFARPKRPRS